MDFRKYGGLKRGAQLQLAKTSRLRRITAEEHQLRKSGTPERQLSKRIALNLDLPVGYVRKARAMRKREGSRKAR